MFRTYVRDRLARHRTRRSTSADRVEPGRRPSDPACRWSRQPGTRRDTVDGRAGARPPYRTKSERRTRVAGRGDPSGDRSPRRSIRGGDDRRGGELRTCGGAERDGSSAEALAALEAAGADHGATTARGHPRTETVLVRPLTGVGLEGALAHGGLLGPLRQRSAGRASAFDSLILGPKRGEQDALSEANGPFVRRTTRLFHRFGLRLPVAALPSPPRLDRQPATRAENSRSGLWTTLWMLGRANSMSEPCR